MCRPSRKSAHHTSRGSDITPHLAREWEYGYTSKLSNGADMGLSQKGGPFFGRWDRETPCEGQKGPPIILGGRSASGGYEPIPPPKFGHLRSLSRGYALGHPISPTGWDWGTGARASPRPCPPVQKSLAFLHFDGHPGRFPSSDSLSHRRRGPKF